MLSFARPPVQAMIAFIDDHREVHGVEPICKVLPIAMFGVFVRTVLVWHITWAVNSWRFLLLWLVN